jgi:two-component system, chemotaxis family, sensor kinase CheA
VARLEEFSRDIVEVAGSQEVVQYRSQIMPLLRLANILSPGAAEWNADADTMQVVVYSHAGKSIGLVVGKIADIVEEVISVQRKSREPGILGSAVIQHKVTDVIDIHGLLQLADPSLLSDLALQ